MHVGLNEQCRMNGFGDDYPLMIDEAFTLSGNVARSEAPTSSLLLARVPQGRDIVTVLLLLRYCDVTTVDVAGKRMIGLRDDASFNVFVDYAPETGDWMLIHRGRSRWYPVEVPHNREVATYVRSDEQLSSMIPIELVDLGFRDLNP